MTTWNELSQDGIDNVLAWASGEAWCYAMAECQQDAQWHSEGDVWTHTKMVCAQLTPLDEWSHLAQRERTVLLFAALFHDSGKPETSLFDPETKRIHSPKHAIRGEHLARQVLRELGCDIVTREEIARLVRFHGRPAFLLERTDPKLELISLSWLVNHKLLYLLALADTRGRRTNEMTRPDENLHFWKMVAEENQCYDQPYPFANDQARFLFYRQELSDLHYIPHVDFRCTVTMMSGLPGSGKDTWLSGNRGESPVISLDDLRSELGIEATDDQGTVVQAAKERCRELLRARTSFSFSATNLLRATRKRWIDLFTDYGARIEIVYVEPPFPLLLQRNRQRDKSVPEDVILDLAAKCDPPTLTECHGLRIVEEQA
jgi:predicted kinase